MAYFETFSGPDGASINGDHEWSIRTAGWETISGQAVSKSGSSVTALEICNTQTIAQDQFIEAKVKILEYKGDAGGTSNAEPNRLDLVLWADSVTDTFLYFRVDRRQDDRVYIVQSVNGTHTTLAPLTYVTLPARPFAARATVKDNGNGTVTIDGLLNGVRVISYTGATDVPSSAYIGLRSQRSRSDANTTLSEVVFGPSIAADTTPPNPPVAALAGKDIDKITIDWVPDDLKSVTYQAFKNGALAADGITALSYTFSGLTEKTQYILTVKAVDAAGNISLESNKITTSTYEDTGFYMIDQYGHKRIARQRQIKP